MPRKINAAASLAASTTAAEQGRASAREAQLRAFPVREVKLSDLVPNPANPARRAADDLDELTASIREVGVLQPVVARARRSGDPDGGDFILLGGHRRWAAAKLAGIETVLARIVDAEQDVQLMLIENLQRADITPMEEARWFQLLRDEGLTQKQIAAKVGISQGQVSKRLQLLTMPPTLQLAVEESRIPLEAVKLVSSLTKDAAKEVTDGLEKRLSNGTPVSDRDIDHLIGNARWNERQRKDQVEALKEAKAAGARVVDSRDELPEDAVYHWPAEDERTVEAGHLYFLAPRDLYDRGTYFHNDPTLLQERDDREGEADASRARIRELATRVDQAQDALWQAWAETVGERGGDHGGHQMAEWVLAKSANAWSVSTSLQRALRWSAVTVKNPHNSGEVTEVIHDLPKGLQWRLARLVVGIDALDDSTARLVDEHRDALGEDLISAWTSACDALAAEESREDAADSDDDEVTA